MQYIKLQLGCILVILYILIAYLKATSKKGIPCNKYFDRLLIIAPWAVFFDGFTAWSVNHLDFVPEIVNTIAHLMFFIFMDLCIIVTAVYMYNQILGIRKIKEKICLYLPGIISLILILAGIGKIKYLEGTITNYSMGFSVYVCFVTIMLYYGAILLIVISRKRFISKDKRMITMAFIITAGIILAIQIIFPEVLLSSILPTILLLGIYIEFENPSNIKLIMHKDEMTAGFATLVESRDNNTGGHIKRTKAYVNLMLDKMRFDKAYKEILNRDYITNVSNAAPLHDIGKVATPDNILQKPGKLTDEEYAIIKKHAAEGGDIILNTFSELDTNEFRQIAYEVARHHHEKYNGKGYPDGLEGEQIPLHARIMAVADVFDAVSQRRCYRDAMPVEECFGIIEKGSGSDFDPKIVKIFLEAKEEIIDLMNKGMEKSDDRI